MSYLEKFKDAVKNLPMEIWGFCAEKKLTEADAEIARLTQREGELECYLENFEILLGKQKKANESLTTKNAHLHEQADTLMKRVAELEKRLETITVECWWAEVPAQKLSAVQKEWRILRQKKALHEATETPEEKP